MEQDLGLDLFELNLVTETYVGMGWARVELGWCLLFTHKRTSQIKRLSQGSACFCTEVAVIYLRIAKSLLVTDL